MEDDDLKEYANLEEYGISTQDDYEELCKVQEKCKANESQIIIDSYRLKLGSALMKIDSLKDEIAELNGERRGN